MFKTITPAEMKRVEMRVMSKTTLTGEELMERAAAHIAHAVARLVRGHEGMVLCLCGVGNNGGDGLAAMRLLMTAEACLVGECWIVEGMLSTDAKRELDKLLAHASAQRITVRMLRAGDPIVLPRKVCCVIDALLGTGLSRPLSGMVEALCAVANTAYQNGVPVVAVDIPSGLDGETGDVRGCAVHATETIVFHRPKLGLYLSKGPNHTGQVCVVDIGLPLALDDAEGLWVMQRKDVHLPARERVSHKGNYGRVLLWVGHLGMAGAAAISALAALRTGAGLVTVACPENIVNVVQVLCPCAMCIPLPLCVDDAENESIAQKTWELLSCAVERADAIGVGCGLGQDAITASVMKKLIDYLSKQKKPAVLDADALNLVAVNGQNVAQWPSAVLTPHPAEAARLLGCTVNDVVDDPVEAARKLHRLFGASVVLKGAASVLLTGEGMALNPFGTPAMAKGGSGDALTGVLCALLAGKTAGAYAGMGELDILQMSCALHGLAGEKAEEKFGERGMLTTDLCECLGRVGK